MHLERILLRYTRIFNWLGESCVISSDLQYKRQSILKCIARNIPLFISTALVVALTVSDLLFELSISDSSEKATSVIYAIFFGTIISIKLVGISQSHTFWKKQPKLFDQFREFTCMTESKFVLNTSKFQNQFLSECGAIFATWLITFTLNILMKYEPHEPHSKLFVNFCVTSMKLLNRITMCHVLFYVVLVNHFIDSFVDYVQQTTFNIKLDSIDDIKTELIFVKVIHFKLYEISRTVNVIFGWIFVSIFTQEFVDFMYQLYWIILLMDCPFYNTIRKLINRYVIN